MSEAIQHGGSGHAYANLGCRCNECRGANAERVKRRRLERTLEPKDPNDPRHGKATFYINHGCRCDPCTKAHVEQCRAYAMKRREQQEAA